MSLLHCLFICLVALIPVLLLICKQHYILFLEFLIHIFNFVFMWSVFNIYLLLYQINYGICCSPDSSKNRCSWTAYTKIRRPLTSLWNFSIKYVLKIHLFQFFPFPGRSFLHLFLHILCLFHLVSLLNNFIHSTFYIHSIINNNIINFFLPNKLFF